MLPAAAVHVHDERHVLSFSRNVEIKLLLRPDPSTYGTLVIQATLFAPVGYGCLVTVRICACVVAIVAKRQQMRSEGRLKIEAHPRVRKRIFIKAKGG